jgi:predicted PurR-regulated permease PerM
LDEIIQWIVPGRFWNFKDVRLNLISGGLIQLAIWQVIGPKSVSKKVNKKSLRIFSATFACCLIILGLCVLNTPNRVYSYTNRIQWLSFLQKEESMSEFGYKHKNPEIGVFYSRLSVKSLKKTDYLMDEKYSQILNKSVNIDYGQFLREYSPITNPFMHELRVHIFRRDTYLKKGKSASSLKDKKGFYFIAYKENLILEKYFKNSIEKSVYRWNEDTLRESEALIDKSKPYESPVSANLFTSFSEKTVWIVIFFIIFILVQANLVLPFIKKSNRNKSLRSS